jgi:RND family efflux transporter MFP subunit
MRSAAVIAFLGLTLLAGCEKPQPTAEIRPVRTVAAAAGAGGEPLQLTGHIRARTEQNLAFRIDGKMITRKVDIGSVVQPNDLIAELDLQPQRDALHQAQAKLAAAEATLHEASNNMDRQRTLVNQGWSTKVQYDSAERSFETAKAQLAVAKAQLHEAEDHFSYSELRADAPGVVISKSVEPGEVVRAGQTVVTVAHYDGTDAVFDVPASLMRQISPDALITVALTDDPKIRTTGRARETAPQADATTRSFRVKVGLDQVPEAMRLGATVFGETRMLASKGIELPGTALTSVDNRPAVWVVDPKSMQVSLRPIELQQQASSSIVVSQGIEPGDLVVTAGVHALRPGQKVRLLGGTS